MGDRAYTQFDIPTFIVTAKRKVIISAIQPNSEQDEEDGSTTFTLEDSNAGGAQEAKRLQKLGIAFVVRWDHGDDYPAGVTCFVPGHDPITVDSFGFGEGPAVLVRTDGTCDEELLTNARSFLALLRVFRAQVGSPQASTPA